MAVGVAVGLATDQVGLGLALGLIGGSIITLALERKRRRHGGAMLAVAIVAFGWIIARQWLDPR